MSRRSGAGPGLVLGLHGGPGGGDYLHDLHELATAHRRVVTFDQLGTGKSETVPPGRVWSFEEAVDDVDAVRAAYGAEQVDVIGHSYGGMLALQYVLAYPSRVRRLVLWSTVGSVARMVGGFLRQLTEVLPDHELEAAMTADVLGKHDDPRFRAALRAWLRAYFTDDDEQLAELVDEITRPDSAAQGLWGSRLWLCDGALSGWDAEPLLPAITQPVLVVHGGRDTSGPDANRALATGISNSEWITLAAEGHMLSRQGTALFLRLVEGFLDMKPDREGISDD